MPTAATTSGQTEIPSFQKKKKIIDKLQTQRTGKQYHQRKDLATAQTNK
jgi:hypothetical protein